MIDRIANVMGEADFEPGPSSFETDTETWPMYWTTVLILAVLGGALRWVIGGWWYKQRIEWSGDDDPDPAIAKQVYTYAGLVYGLPMVLGMLLATFLFEDLRTYWETEEVWSLAIMAGIFYSFYVSYAGVTTRFAVARGKALAWFLVLPVLLQVFAFLIVIFAYSMIAAA